jgi:hypothetical protein
VDRNVEFVMITSMNRHLRASWIVLVLGLLSSAGNALRAGQPAQAPHDFSRWEKDIAAFEAADRSNPPPKDAILFVGCLSSFPPPQLPRSPALLLPSHPDPYCIPI